VVQTELGGVGLLADILLLLALGDSGSLLGKTLLLLGLGLRAVLVEELESLGSEVAVGNVLELGNRRGDLQAKVEDLLLALKTNVRGPADHATEVALGLDVLTDAEVLGALLDERVLSSLLAAGLGLGERRGRRLLSFGRHFEYWRGSIIENRNYQRMFIH